MVDFRTILQLVEFILCILYDGVALIVIPDCIEAVAFYTKIVTAAHVGVSEQIQGLKLAVVHILLTLVIVTVTLIRFWIRTEGDLSQDGASDLCSRCLQREREREIKKGLLISEYLWLHKF